MPRFQVTRSVATRDASAIRVRCDGCDPARPCDEHARSAALWLVTAGAFELRDAAGRHMLDPTRALVMPRGHAFQIRHPAGPDTCVAFRGPLIDALAAHGPRMIEIAPATLARLTAQLARPDDELALGETIAQLAPAGHAITAPRDLAGAVADRLRAQFAAPTSLGELASATGYSVFHTCRVFRAATGTTIHGFRRELRLRHALARILDSRDSLTEIALATGFASQSHLTNLFRARFGITPARARTPAGQRALSSIRV
ncbi:MAG TPA: helix-turn-helix domain-containing protein [Kofleriaceae bacterium]|nr:helix-turn-helix domain-containing protein [Kofleriaceae bacterium]